MATSPLLILIGLFFLLPSSALCPGPGLAGLPVVVGSSLILGGFGGFGRPARCSRFFSYFGVVLGGLAGLPFVAGSSHICVVFFPNETSFWETPLRIKEKASDRWGNWISGPNPDAEFVCGCVFFSRGKII